MNERDKTVCTFRSILIKV